MWPLREDGNSSASGRAVARGDGGYPQLVVPVIAPRVRFARPAPRRSLVAWGLRALQRAGVATAPVAVPGFREPGAPCG